MIKTADKWHEKKLKWHGFAIYTQIHICYTGHDQNYAHNRIREWTAPFSEVFFYCRTAFCRRKTALSYLSRVLFSVLERHRFI